MGQNPSLSSAWELPGKLEISAPDVPGLRRTSTESLLLISFDSSWWQGKKQINKIPEGAFKHEHKKKHQYPICESKAV